MKEKNIELLIESVILNILEEIERNYILLEDAPATPVKSNGDTPEIEETSIGQFVGTYSELAADALSLILGPEIKDKGISWSTMGLAFAGGAESIEFGQVAVKILNAARKITGVQSATGRALDFVQACFYLGSAVCFGIEGLGQATGPKRFQYQVLSLLMLVCGVIAMGFALLGNKKATEFLEAANNAPNITNLARNSAASIELENGLIKNANKIFEGKNGISKFEIDEIPEAAVGGDLDAITTRTGSITAKDINGNDVSFSIEIKEIGDDLSIKVDDGSGLVELKNFDDSVFTDLQKSIEENYNAWLDAMDNTGNKTASDIAKAKTAVANNPMYQFIKNVQSELNAIKGISKDNIDTMRREIVASSSDGSLKLTSAGEQIRSKLYPDMTPKEFAESVEINFNETNFNKLVNKAEDGSKALLEFGNAPAGRDDYLWSLGESLDDAVNGQASMLDDLEFSGKITKHLNTVVKILKYFRMGPTVTAASKAIVKNRSVLVKFQRKALELGRHFTKNISAKVKTHPITFRYKKPNGEFINVDSGIVLEFHTCDFDGALIGRLKSSKTSIQKTEAKITALSDKIEQIKNWVETPPTERGGLETNLLPANIRGMNFDEGTKFVKEGDKYKVVWPENKAPKQEVIDNAGTVCAVLDGNETLIKIEYHKKVALLIDIEISVDAKSYSAETRKWWTTQLNDAPEQIKSDLRYTGTHYVRSQGDNVAPLPDLDPLTSKASRMASEIPVGFFEKKEENQWMFFLGAAGLRRGTQRAVGTTETEEGTIFGRDVTGVTTYKVQKGSDLNEIVVDPAPLLLKMQEADDTATESIPVNPQ